MIPMFQTADPRATPASRLDLRKSRDDRPDHGDFDAVLRDALRRASDKVANPNSAARATSGSRPQDHPAGPAPDADTSACTTQEPESAASDKLVESGPASSGEDISDGCGNPADTDLSRPWDGVTATGQPCVIWPLDTGHETAAASSSVTGGAAKNDPLAEAASLSERRAGQNAAIAEESDMRPGTGHSDNEARITVRALQDNAGQGRRTEARQDESVLLPALDSPDQRDGAAQDAYRAGATPQALKRTEDGTNVTEEMLGDFGEEADALALNPSPERRADRISTVLSASPVRDVSAEQSLLRQISEAVIQQRSSHGAAEISLSGKELGHLSMTVAQGDDSVAVTLTADRPETLDLLKRNIDQLAQDLQDLGFQSLSFSFQQGNRQGTVEFLPDPDDPLTTENRLAELLTGHRIEPSVHHRVQTSAEPGGGLDLRL